MTGLEKGLRKEDLQNSREETQESETTNLISKNSLIKRLKSGPEARAGFVESHIDKTLAFQIRSLRGDLSQQQVEQKTGIKQQVFSRYENPFYGKTTITALKRIAAAFDVGLLVEFVPFGRLIDRVSGTPRIDMGLSPQTMNIPNFEAELPMIEMSRDVEQQVPMPVHVGREQAPLSTYVGSIEEMPEHLVLSTRISTALLLENWCAANTSEGLGLLALPTEPIDSLRPSQHIQSVGNA